MTDSYLFYISQMTGSAQKSPNTEKETKWGQKRSKGVQWSQNLYLTNLWS